jgi:acetate kinase
MIRADATARVLLAINGGSSTVKCALFSYGADPTPLARGVLDDVGGGSVPALLTWIDGHTDRSAIAAIGHRIVHGGPEYTEPQAISPRVHDDLLQLVPFAPNHLPEEIAIVDVLAEHAPGIPQVACFDTAFHQRMPDVARRLPIPASYDRRGVRRYGFHGLSYAFLIEELTRVAGPEAARGRVILAHLGNGSSLAAIQNGVSIDTTMAFTPIGGVVMSTRSGDLDPGVVTYLARTEAVSANEIEEILSKRAGLLGLSGTTGDMRQLLARERDDEDARLAVSAYVYSVVKAVGAFTAILGGLDTLVFSGGIGEHAAAVRARVCGALTYLGVTLDPAANDSHAAVISRDTSRAVVRVIPTDEELMIARATYRVVAGGDGHARNR